MQMANVNIHLLSRTARAAWNWLRVRRSVPIFAGKRLNRPPGAVFFTTPIEQDSGNGRKSGPNPTSCPC